MCETTTRKAEFRPLRADEIDVRVQSVGKNNSGGFYAILLLYKDARVDMTLLDEKYGPFGWKRQHSFLEGRNYCEVSVKCPDTGEWVSKQDVGTESNTEEVKGEASDAFKRACVNLGIGRELYTTPSIIISVGKEEVSAWNDKQGKTIYRMNARTRFAVSFVGYDNPESVARKITDLQIIDQNGEPRFTFGNPPKHKQQRDAAPAPAAPKTKTKCITMRTVENEEQCAKMLEMLKVAYDKNPDGFIVGDYLRGQGFVIDDETAAVASHKLANYLMTGI